MIEYVWVALLLPLGAAMLCGVASRLSPRKAALAGCVAAGGSLAISWSVFWEVLLLPESERAGEVVLWPWITCGKLSVPVGFFVDPLSSLMLLAVCAIAFLVHCYCVEYGAGDEGCRRLIACLGLSTFFMLLVVLADNFLLLFLGWEGLGVGASLLIGFHSRRGDAVSEGGKALVSGRVADYGMVLALLLIAVTFKSLNFSAILAAAAGTLPRAGIVATMLTLLLAVAACGKAAQLPFRMWLAHAREVPMAGLALLCGATGVGAGAYLLLRCGPLFALAPVSLWMLSFLGATSAVWAGAVAATQSDLRKLLAYLAVSQLGLVFLACGAGAFGAAFLQLVVQALCVSLLVLGAGSVSAALAGETDISTMGGLRPLFPWTFACVLVAALSLAGIPPLAGFLSKSLVLQAVRHKDPLLYGAGALASLLTAFCLFRMVSVVFVGERAAAQPPIAPGKESPRAMVLSLSVLAVLAGVGGWAALPDSWGGGAWLQRFLAPMLPAAAASPAEEWTAAAVGLGTALLGIGAAQVLYVRRLQLPALIVSRLGALHRLFLNGWYLEAFYDTLFMQPIGQAAKRLQHGVDEELVDRAFCGVARMCLGLAENSRPLHELSVAHWALVMLGGGVLLVGYCLWQ